MAYDEALAERIRALLAGEAGVTEQKMFGGLAFLIGGNMAVAASGQGGALVRVDPERSDAIVASSSARPMEMRGREMAGWLRVASEDLRTKRQLAKWVTLGATYARSLPAKKQSGSPLRPELRAGLPDLHPIFPVVDEVPGDQGATDRGHERE